MNTPTIDTLTDKTNGTITTLIEMPTALYKLLKSELPTRTMTRFVVEQTATGMLEILERDGEDTTD